MGVSLAFVLGFVAARSGLIAVRRGLRFAPSILLRRGRSEALAPPRNPHRNRREQSGAEVGGPPRRRRRREAEEEGGRRRVERELEDVRTRRRESHFWGFGVSDMKMGDLVRSLVWLGSLLTTNWPNG